MIDRNAFGMMSAGLALAAMITAPNAGADSRRTCQEAGSTTICQTNGSVAIVTKPGTKAPPANRPQIPWWIPGMPGNN